MRGFTLVEILVALTLFSLVLTMIFGGLHTSGRTWERGEAQITTNDNLRLELAFVRKQLEQAVPLVLLNGRDNPVLFKGEQHAIHFTSQLPGHRGGGGLFLLSLTMIEQEGAQVLQLAYQPISADIDLDDLDNDSEEVKTLPMMTDIETLEFSYFGSEEENTDPVWANEWLAPQRLPELVRIHVQSTRAGRYIPDLIVKLATQNARGQPQLTLYKNNQDIDAEIDVRTIDREDRNSEVRGNAGRD